MVGTILNSRNLLLFGSFCSVFIVSWFSYDMRNQTIWFNHIDQNAYLLYSGLIFNDNRDLMLSTHPGIGAFILHGLELKMLHFFKLVEVSDIKSFFELKDPLVT